MNRRTHDSTWRTPALVMAVAGAALAISLGQRHSFGLYLPPMTSDLALSRETFSLAIALQNLLWGLAQPFTGMIADKFGSGKVVAVGAILYAAGLLLMARSGTGQELWLSAGLLIGLGLSGTSFGVLYAVVAKAVEPAKRTTALGIVGALGSFGQFAMLPLNQALITTVGWAAALFALSFLAALMLPMSAVLAERDAPAPAATQRQSLTEALREAFAHSGFWLLTIGFLTCGFQLTAIATHLPAYLGDQKISANVGMTALALVGLFNVLGTYLCGYLGDRYRKKHLLSGLYLIRSGVIALFILLPVSPFTVYVFAAAMGLLWLGTVPLTNGVVAQIFGVQYVATLFGFVFFSHQVGGFLGAWVGGWIFDAAGSYSPMWMIAIVLGVVAGIVNWPIDDRQVRRLQPA
jgi:MFS family permease